MPASGQFSTIPGLHCIQTPVYQSEQWLERHLKKQVPAAYFLLTFTLPEELRPLAWQHQRTLYDLMIRCSWETLKTFAHNDPQLQGKAGAISVLHTHSRRLDYHPHVHVVMPAAAIDADERLWRTKTAKANKSYLFSHKALAKVFRAKLLAAICEQGLELPSCYPKTWVVDAKSVGSGDKALVYLGRYLYNHMDVVYAGFAGAKTCQGRDPGKGYYRLPGWLGDVPLPRRQNQTDANPDAAGG